MMAKKAAARWAENFVLFEYLKFFQGLDSCVKPIELTTDCS